MHVLGQVASGADMTRDGIEVERVIREKTALIAQPIRIGRQVVLTWDGESILLRNLAGAIWHIQPEKLGNVRSGNAAPGRAIAKDFGWRNDTTCFFLVGVPAQVFAQIGA